jgi:DNA-binding MarR family transcriptional regulator
MTRPVYGIIEASECFHLSPDCIRIRRGPGTRRAQRYASEDEAIKAGHNRMCPVCVKDLVVEIDGKPMRITVEQHDTLKTIKKLHDKTGEALKLSQIAEARGCHVSTCYVLVRSLFSKNLVSKEYDEGKRKARNGTIQPTPLADRVLTQLAAA